MFLKNVDYLSPKITLYNQGEIRHSSIFSGILTSLVYAIVVAIGIYLSCDVIQRKSPSAFYFNGYKEDAGFFPLNSSSIFHYIEIINTETGNTDPVDYDSIRIIGLMQTIDLYSASNKNLSNLTHWIYGSCDINKDVKGIANLLKRDNFQNAACVRKYFNIKEQKYYNTDEKGFVWPSVDKGCTHPNRTFYGIIIERCRNDSLKKNCKNINEIESYVLEHSVDFHFINQYTDAYNYKKPLIKYFYDVSNGLFEGSYTNNHLNFNPALIITQTGLIFDIKKKELTYFFSQNEKITTYWDVNDVGIYVTFYFWMQNQMQYHERTYKRLINVLADIGGIGNSILFIAQLLSKLFNKYIKILDTQDLIIEIDKKLGEVNLFNSNIIKFYPMQKSQSDIKLNYEKSDQNDDKISHKIILSRNIESTLEKNILNNNDQKNDRSIGTKNYLLANNLLNYNNLLINVINKKKQVNQNNCMIFNNKNTSADKYIKKISYNFFQYILYLLCNKKNKIIRYEDFRKKIISEEQVIQSYIKLYKLLNIFNSNKNCNVVKSECNIDLTLIMNSIISK